MWLPTSVIHPGPLSLTVHDYPYKKITHFACNSWQKAPAEQEDESTVLKPGYFIKETNCLSKIVECAKAKVDRCHVCTVLITSQKIHVKVDPHPI